VAYTIPQLKGAHKLGFPVVRLQYFVSPVIERLLPYAEKYNLKMGYELHVPLMIEAEKTQELIEQIKRISSPHLGLIPDTGIFARSIPKHRIESVRASGVSEYLLQKALELWRAETPLEPALAELKAIGLEKRQIGVLEDFWAFFGHSDPKALAQIMPYIIHIHGKFYTMIKGDEPDIRFEEVVRALIKGGYKGWMSSEYEGHLPDVDSFEIVKEHQKMVRRYIAKYSK
jgi:hypothetical protein